MNTALPINPAAPKATLSGWRLWFGRLLWAVVLLLVLLLLSELWPENGRVTRGEWAVTLTRPVVTTFMAYADFVRFVAWLESLATITALLMGLLIFWHKSDDRMGLFVSAFLILVSPLFLSGNIDTWRLPAGVPFSATLIALMAAAALCSLILFLYLFPDGRFVPGWTRWTATFTLLILGTSILGIALAVPIPFDVDVWLVAMITITGSLVVASVSQLHRYRTAPDPLQRQQMKWVILGFWAYITALLFGIGGSFGGPSSWAPLLGLLVTMLLQWLIPLTIGFSILRYRLWEIDLLINRTLVYAVLTALVVGLYVLLVGLAGALFQSGSNALAAILATGLLAVLFEPLRRRLQRGVNRLMYGEQDDPVALLRKLGERMAVAAVPTEAVPALVETIARTLKLPYVAVETASEQWAVGQAQFKQFRFPLMVRSELVGELVVSARSAGERFSGTELKLLEDIARQAGTAIYAARLTADLQHARERLIIAREEERRRLRRDLHDGLGPQLATLTIKVSTAQNLLESDPIATARLLAEVKVESQNAIREIRQVVEGLGPAALDQLGLLSAIQEFVAQNGNGRTQLVVNAPAGVPPLPAAVEVAAYRIALEAMNNSLRHAQAHHCAVNLTVSGRLELEIRDDGVGLPAGYRSGVGLLSMRERAEELNGSFAIVSDAGGTVVTAILPLEA